jgi:hypothetical protein
MSPGRSAEPRHVFRVRVRIRIAIASLVLALIACAPAQARGHRVPARFVGVNASGPLFDPSVNLGQQMSQMVTSGVETVRVVFNWSLAQPYATESQVPASQRSEFVDVDGVPTDFEAMDRIVGLAAQRRLAILPVVIYAPGWDAGTNASGGAAPPARTGPYANFLTALIDRYGPHGTFWRAHRPRVPVRMWQVWNEPNLSLYWSQPFAHSYVKLLRAAHGAIKRADPRATVVLGAIANAAWRWLAKIYAVHGARHLFDVVAVNAFTSTPSRVLQFLRLVRRAINRHGDRTKPLFYTEMSWPTSVGQSFETFDWDTTEAGQARDIATVVPMLAKHRQALGLRAFYYYTWMDAGTPGAFSDFDFAGLSTVQPDGTVVDKPGLAAFKRAALKIEGKGG